ncbi:MAG TPA: PHB depolymerase family esterase [Rhizomicrobium sp.]|nr:PHB depolymerase family esterase [Rhizomicrobium sp.]
MTRPFALAALLALAAGAARADGLVTFATYSHLTGNAEMMRRLYSPLRAEQIRAELAKAHQSLGEQAIDLAQEQFFVSVPPRMPAKGYGLIVFIAPWNEGAAPRGWTDVLAAKGFIFVAAARSGNSQDVAARREPLALLAWQNIAARYTLDPGRVYVAGMSGGARVALRVALGYPDVFDGALLNAGSDPIGSAEIPLPPRELFARFQAHSRLVYLTGALDREHRDMDRRSEDSMRQWCVGNVTNVIAQGLGHEPADPESLAGALDALDVPAAPDPSLAECRADLDRTVAAKLAGVKSLEASGRRDEALSELKDIDATYGGLAAPESVALAKP